MNTESIQRILTSKDEELNDLFAVLIDLDELQDNELDQVLVSNLELVFLDNGDGYLFAKKGDSWRWHGEDILEGTYPLENLPDHVRELAEELYY